MPTLRSGGGSTASHGAVSGDSKDEYIVPVCTTWSVTHTLTAEGFDASEDGTGRGTPVIAFNLNQVTSPTNRSRAEPGAPYHTLTAKHEPPVVCFQPGNVVRGGGASPSTDVVGTLTSQHGRGMTDQFPHVAYTTKLHNTGSNNAGKIFEERTTCLDANSPAPALLTPSQVRRLTPVECERLQGFPDNHTQIPWRKKPADQCPDGPRYKALGNSMAVPVMRWIGQKIDVALLFQE